MSTKSLTDKIHFHEPGKGMQFIQFVSTLSVVFILGLFLAQFIYTQKSAISSNFRALLTYDSKEDPQQGISDFFSDVKFGLQIVNEGLLLVKEEQDKIKRTIHDLLEDSNRLNEDGKKLRSDIKFIAKVCKFASEITCKELASAKDDLSAAKNSYINGILIAIEDKIESSVEEQTASLLESCDLAKRKSYLDQNQQTPPQGIIYAAPTNRKNVSSIPHTEKLAFSEFLQKRSKGKDIILSVLISSIEINVKICNSAWIEFASNWRCSLEALGLSNYILISMDEDIHQVAQTLGIHSYLPSVHG